MLMWGFFKRNETITYSLQRFQWTIVLSAVTCQLFLVFSWTIFCFYIKVQWKQFCYWMWHNLIFLKQIFLSLSALHPWVIQPYNMGKTPALQTWSNLQSETFWCLNSPRYQNLFSHNSGNCTRGHLWSFKPGFSFPWLLFLVFEHCPLPNYNCCYKS